MCKSYMTVLLCVCVLSAVGGRECKVTLCDISSGSATHILRSHHLPVMSLAWSPSNEHLLATGRSDIILYVYNYNPL